MLATVWLTVRSDRYWQIPRSKVDPTFEIYFKLKIFLDTFFGGCDVLVAGTQNNQRLASNR
jgi:hypothetical protein